MVLYDCVYSKKTHSVFISANVNVPVNGSSLKHGFQWLRQQNTVDAVVVDENTNASVLEHLVFMYVLLVQQLNLTLCILGVKA